jgi:hypothetical protein
LNYHDDHLVWFEIGVSCRMLLFFEATWLSALAILWVLGSLEIMTREGCLFEDFPSRSSELDLSGNKRIYENDGRIRG